MSAPTSAPASPPAPQPSARPSRTLRGRVWSASMKLARLGTYFLVIGALSLVVAARVAYGRAKTVAMTTGEDLLRLTENGDVGSGYALRLNGERVFVSSATTAASFDQVLDRFQELCATHADGLSSEFAHLEAATRPGAPLVGVGFPGIGLMRQSTGDAGVVLCFATGRALSETDTYVRLGDFARSGDLGQVGSVRYVVAKKLPGGGAHVVAAWTEGSFDLKKMFPDQGDAPGTDVAHGVRPEQSRRVMSAYAEGAPYGIRVYETARSPQQVFAQYDAAMPALGWQIYPDVIAADPSSRAFSREDVDLVVTAERKGESTMVSIVEMSGH